VFDQAPRSDEGDVGGRCLDIADDVGGEQDDALARQLGQEVAEANPLLRIEAARGLVDDQQTWIVEERLGDADALPHPTREISQTAAAGLAEVHEQEQFVDAAARDRRRQPLGRGQVFEELVGREIGVDAEILRKIAEHGA